MVNGRVSVVLIPDRESYPRGHGAFYMTPAEVVRHLYCWQRVRPAGHLRTEITHRV